MKRNCSACLAVILLSSVVLPKLHGQILSIDVNQRGSGNTQAGFDTLDLDDGGFPNTMKTFGSVGVDVDPVGFSFGNNDRVHSAPTNGGAISQAAILQDFIFADSDTDGLQTTITGLNPNTFYQAKVWSFDSSSSNLRVSDWSVSGTTASQFYTFDNALPPNSDGNSTFTLLGKTDGAGQLVVTGQGNSATDATKPAVFLNGLQLTEIGGTAPPTLSVDFGNSIGTGGGVGGIQDGFTAMEAAEGGGNPPVTQSFFSPAGVGDSVDATISGYTHFRDYNSIADTNAAVGQDSLLNDMVLRNSDGEMTLTLENLLPGGYEITTYHHSTQFGGGTFDVELTDSMVTDMLLFDDAAVSAGYGSAGERCMAISVIVAEGGVGDALVDRIRAKSLPGSEAIDSTDLIREDRDSR